MLFDTAILGGGWSGVCLANALKNRSVDSNLFLITAGNPESSAGLLLTEECDGFTFDVGGSHVIFSKNPTTLTSLLGHLNGNYVEHKRNSFINFGDFMVPYPLENGISELPTEEREKLGYDMIKAIFENQRRRDWKPRNLGEFFNSVFGEQATRSYFGPYNEKIWKHPLDELANDWVYISGRLPTPNLEDVVASVAGIKTVGYAEQAKFYYPKTGGIKTLYNSVLSDIKNRQVKTLYNETVVKIRKKNNKWIINDKIETKRLHSTIPVPFLVKALGAPESVIKAAENLDYNNLITVGVALNKKAPDQHWIYVPNKEVLFHRYCWMSNYSKQNAPKGKSAILAEVTVPAGQPYSKEAVIEQTVSDLEKLKVINRDEIVFVKSWFTEFGYPVCTLGKKEKLETIFQYLKEIGVKSVGRWGSWKYWNMDKIYEATIEQSKNPD
ncbi:MAG: amine oxidase [Candidatus Bathyarchaeum sp.]|nr:MAG: amine oxidase [Candidatus Bathyarchaeum sp.]